MPYGWLGKSPRVLDKNDIRGDSQVLFVMQRAERGIRSMAILPLLVADEAVGVLALYADEPGFFDAQAMKLLTELAPKLAAIGSRAESRCGAEFGVPFDTLQFESYR